MKLIILTVILAVVQATPSVPRPKASDKAAGSFQNVSSNIKPRQNPFPEPTPVLPVPHAEPDQNSTSQPSKPNATEPVLVHEVAPAPADSFWWNRFYVIFTGMLVAIGVVGGLLAYRTLNRIDRQAIANEAQLEEIKKAADQADKTFALAEKQAESARIAALATNDLVIAAKVAANAVIKGLEQNRQKDRARIKIMVNRIEPQFTAKNFVSLRLGNVGLSRAYVLNSFGKYFYSESANLEPGKPPDQLLIYDEYIEAGEQIPPISQTLSLPLQPDPALTKDELLKVRKEEAYLHFCGFVRHRDVYEQIWRTNIHLRWTMRFGGMMEGQIMDWWEPVGPPEENAEVLEQSPN